VSIVWGDTCGTLCWLLKCSVVRLHVVCGRKRAAVEKEDYDTAKALKADIDKLRNATQGTNPVPGKGLGIIARSLDDVPVGRPSQADPAEAPAAASTDAVVPAEYLPPLPGTLTLWLPDLHPLFPFCLYNAGLFSDVTFYQAQISDVI
jgi:hypothetical protein